MRLPLAECTGAALVGTALGACAPRLARALARRQVDFLVRDRIRSREDR